MSELSFARLVLGLQALVWFGLALAHWFYPYEMANARGMVLMDSASVAEARVWYGGMAVPGCPASPARPACCWWPSCS